MADFWRGDVSHRQFRVLVNNLSPESAVGRAMKREHNDRHYDGHEWTQLEALVWWLHHRLEEVLFMQKRSQAKRPGSVSKPDLRPYPWSTDEKTKDYGYVEAGDERAAVDYLMGLSAG